MYIRLSHVTFTYPHTETPVISDVSLSFHEGWYGIVGDNGCGKSTLAQLMAGTIHPDKGSVSVRGICAYCPQNTNISDETLQDFASDWSATAQHIRSELAIDDAWPYIYTTLSLGQKRKIQIACTLARRPDIMILDEPTNHLDIASKDALIHLLQEFRGIGIGISHDRDLLDRLTCRTVMATPQGFRMIKGSYGQAETVYNARINSTSNEKHHALQAARRLQREQQRREEVASRTKARRSRRGLAKKDHDTREKIGRAIVSGKDARAAHDAHMMEKRHNAARAKAAAIYVPKRYDGAISQYGTRSQRDVLVDIAEGWIPFGKDITDPLPHIDSETPALHIPHIQIGPTDKIGIVGPNGAGKSTLMRLIVRSLPHDIVHLDIPQEISPRKAHALLKKTEHLSRAEKGMVLSQIAQLNTDPDTLLHGANVSPGEIRKLTIAYGSLICPEILLLDEPTNHLDIHSIEALEHFLQAFVGCVVIISHDMHLIEHVCTKKWDVQTGTSHHTLHI